MVSLFLVHNMHICHLIHYHCNIFFISAVMDCVGCEKCRLWGNLQVLGLGTALKILFSVDGDNNLNQPVCDSFPCLILLPLFQPGVVRNRCCTFVALCTNNCSFFNIVIMLEFLALNLWLLTFPRNVDRLKIYLGMHCEFCAKFLLEPINAL